MNINNHYANIEIISNGYGQPRIDKIGYDGYSTDIPIPNSYQWHMLELETSI